MKHHSVRDMLYINFTWAGTAVPAPRMTQSDKWRKPPRKCVSDYWGFRDSLYYSAYQAGWKSGYNIETISLIFYMPVPNSRKGVAPKSPHQVKPDLDNLAKAVLDALQLHDQTCYHMELKKLYDDGRGPRIEIKIEAASELT